jgi:hypothetical protein
VKLIGRAFAGALLALVAMGQVAPQAAAAAEADDVDARVLVVSVPGVTWADVKKHDLPNIEAFLETASVANMAPRGVSPRSDPGAAYLTISAGARARGLNNVDGQQLAVDERSGGSSGAEIFERRTGVVADGEYVSLGWPSLTAANARQPYGAKLGLLYDTLAEAGQSAMAIGNADGSESSFRSFERQAGLAVAGSDGVISRSDLSDDLLVEGPDRPYGVVLDGAAVVDRFSSYWADLDGSGGMVLVEASDLARVMRYKGEVSGPRYIELYAEALADADATFGRLLESVDQSTDAVLLVSPYNLPGDRDLTIAALSDPASTGVGYLRSASTQRWGFLTLVDVAPTILDVLGVERPVAMEGRPAEASSSSASVSERVDRMATRNEESRFREHLLFPTTFVVVILLTVVCALAVVLIVRGVRSGVRDGARLQGAVSFGALIALAILPMSYLARALPLERHGDLFYWGFLLVAATGLAGVAMAVSKRRKGGWRAALIVVLAVVLVVPLLDVMFNSELSLSAAFGYSATGNSRLYGISNYAFGHVSASACLLAALMVPRGTSVRRRLAAIGLLVVVLVIIGVPIWGSDVGGILAFTPTVLLFAVLILQIRVTARVVVAGGVATVLAITAFGLFDLARPAGERAHLGRLFERVGDEGIDVLVDLIERKGLAMLSVTGSSFWLAAVPVSIAFILFLARYPGGRLDAIYARDPSFRIGLIALYTAAILGTLANDSGVIIGGMALMVAAASLAILALEAPASAPSIKLSGGSSRDKVREPV